MSTFTIRAVVCICLSSINYDFNRYCFNCNALGTGWACVMHGTVICLDCAGKHRSLGVRISFVRSLTMDKWTQHQVTMYTVHGCWLFPHLTVIATD